MIQGGIGDLKWNTTKTTENCELVQSTFVYKTAWELSFPEKERDAKNSNSNNNIYNNSNNNSYSKWLNKSRKWFEKFGSKYFLNQDHDQKSAKDIANKMEPYRSDNATCLHQKFDLSSSGFF